MCDGSTFAMQVWDFCNKMESQQRDRVFSPQIEWNKEFKINSVLEQTKRKRSKQKKKTRKRERWMNEWMDVPQSIQRIARVQFGQNGSSSETRNIDQNEFANKAQATCFFRFRPKWNGIRNSNWKFVYLERKSRTAIALSISYGYRCCGPFVNANNHFPSPCALGCVSRGKQIRFLSARVGFFFLFILSPSFSHFDW